MFKSLRTVWEFLKSHGLGCKKPFGNRFNGKKISGPKYSQVGGIT